MIVVLCLCLLTCLLLQLSRPTATGVTEALGGDEADGVAVPAKDEDIAGEPSTSRAAQPALNMFARSAFCALYQSLESCWHSCGLFSQNVWLGASLAT